jgi:hypothetical protein
MRKDLDRLVQEGEALFFRMLFDLFPDQLSKTHKKEHLEKLPKFEKNYQRWYSEALAALLVLLPNRVEDFKSYYHPAKPRKDLNHTTYTISDYLKGTSVTTGYDKREIVGPKAAQVPMQQQVEIVKAATARFESSLFDIKAMAQADLFDNELDAAEALNIHGFSRGAGAIAGVVLEGHLATVCANHAIVVGKKKPTLSDFYEALKSNDIIDQQTWRFIQHLADVRNACDHRGKKEPTKDDVLDLITLPSA